MTVAQLIFVLEKIEDKTLPVLTEGCDCYGDALGLVIEPPTTLSPNGYVLIVRHPIEPVVES
jgi:hypothetical protein